MKSDGVPLRGDSPHDRCGFVGDVVVNQKERRLRARRAERVQQCRRPRRIWPIVERQIDRLRRSGRRNDAPQRVGRFERFEQKRERRGVCECHDAGQHGDDND